MGKCVRVRTRFGTVRQNPSWAERRTEFRVRFSQSAKLERELEVRFVRSRSNAVHEPDFDTFNIKYVEISLFALITPKGTQHFQLFEGPTFLEALDCTSGPALDG